MDRQMLRRVTGLTDKRGRIFVVSGPSGVGKDTVLSELLSSRALPGVSKVVTATTRPKRPGEQDGCDYLFLTEGEFLARRSAGWFFETAQFGSHWYGTPRDSFERICASGRDAILKIDTQGAISVRREVPEAVLIFIHPPSLDELVNRLVNRATESERSIAERTVQARLEMERAAMYDYVIVNDRVAEAVDALRAVILAERHRVVQGGSELPHPPVGREHEPGGAL